MDRRLRMAMIVITAAVLLCCAALIMHKALQYGQVETIQTAAETLANLQSTAGEQTSAEQVPVHAEAAFLQGLDLVALQAVNPDVLGWIHIPGTNISYPLLQGSDNEYYLHHTWDKQKSSLGAIFLEQQAQPDLGDFNTIIYGHNMLNDSMFCPLLEYKTQSHLDDHPTFYIADKTAVRRYDIFAAFEADITSPVYRLGIEEAAARQVFLDYSLKNTVIRSPITPTAEDLIVTLSTCMGTGQHETRWVVQGVLTDCFAPAAEAPAAEH